VADTNRTRRIWLVGTIVEPWGEQLNAGKEDLSLGDCSGGANTSGPPYSNMPTYVNSDINSSLPL